MPTPRHAPKILMDVNAFILGCGLSIVVSSFPFWLYGDPIRPRAYWKIVASCPCNFPLIEGKRKQGSLVAFERRR